MHWEWQLYFWDYRLSEGWWRRRRAGEWGHDGAAKQTVKKNIFCFNLIIMVTVKLLKGELIAMLSRIWCPDTHTPISCFSGSYFLVDLTSDLYLLLFWISRWTSNFNYKVQQIRSNSLNGLNFNQKAETNSSPLWIVWTMSVISQHFQTFEGVCQMVYSQINLQHFWCIT